MNLKDYIHDEPLTHDSVIDVKYIKEKILEFEKEIKQDIKDLMSERLLTEPNKKLFETIYRTMLFKHKRIFGDWKK